MNSHTQVKLRLTENPDILSALRRNGAMRHDPQKNSEYFSAQFDAFEYRFYPNVDIIVPANVAEGLYKASGVLVGNNALSDQQQPGLDRIETWELGEQEPSRKASKTVCSVCGEDQKTIKALIAHIATHEEEEPEVKE